jgi:CubicO group peptidase (beta-lactamase class C family)
VSLDDARRVIEDAIKARVFPAASCEVGVADGFIWSEQFGTLTFDAGAASAIHDTIFDLASLTKPIATASIVMALVHAGVLALDARVAGFFDDWRGLDREHVTVRDLLEHASGLPARLVDPPPHTRREFEHDISTIRLEYEPRTQSVYSDLGFILLGLLLERVGGGSLAGMFERLTRIAAVHAEPSGETGPSSTASETAFDFAIDDVLAFGVAVDARPWAAPTEPLADDPRRGRRLVGEVHDNYAAALGGVAGHAGLFGNAAGVGAFARTVLAAAQGRRSRAGPFSPELVAEFTARSTVPGSSRALGWDTMLPTSSCGGRMSPRAFGHAGFTGTSLWIDPVRDRYFVLLTNRACGGGLLDQMRAVRRAFHDALGDV